MTAARVAATLGIRWFLVIGKARIPDVQTSLAGEELSIAGVAGGQDAVEHVDPSGHALDEILWRPGTHQIPGLLFRQTRRGGGNDVVHDVNRLPDAQPSDRISLEADRLGGFGTFATEVRKDSPLHDAKLRLPGVADDDVRPRGGPQRREPTPATGGPANRPLHRRGRLVPCGWIGKTFIEDHRDVRPELRLDVHSPLRRQLMPGPVDMRLEVGPVLGDATPLRETEYLIPAAVSQDGPVPAYEAMETAAPSYELVTRPQVEVIRVAQDDLGARLFEVFEERSLDGTLCPDRHEGRRVNDTVRRVELAEAGTSDGARQRKTKLVVQDVYSVARSCRGFRRRTREFCGYYGSHA